MIALAIARPSTTLLGMRTGQAWQRCATGSTIRGAIPDHDSLLCLGQREVDLEPGHPHRHAFAVLFAGREPACFGCAHCRLVQSLAKPCTILMSRTQPSSPTTKSRITVPSSPACFASSVYLPVHWPRARASWSLRRPARARPAVSPRSPQRLSRALALSAGCCPRASLVPCRR